MTEVVVLPGVPALLREYAGLTDPVADLRAACREALTDLVASDPARICVWADPVDPSNLSRGVAVPVGRRVVEELLLAIGWSGDLVSEFTPGDALVVVANGSSRRGEKAPGHLDERSFDFDEQLLSALRAGDPAALLEVDLALASELLAEGVTGLRALATVVTDRVESSARYADDPFGVSWWVVSWR